MVVKQPRSGLEASRLVQEYEETRTFSKGLQPWKSYAGQSNQPYNSEQGSGGGSNVVFGSPSGGTSGGGSSVVSGAVGNGANQPHVQDNGSIPVVEREGGKQGQQYQGSRKQVTCYGCHEVGHIRPNCPYKVRRVVAEGGGSMPSVNGFLAGVAVEGLKVDTGSDKTMVRKDYVPRVAYTGRSVLLGS